jgi:SMI1 / KNR4 family (SUKH-1)
MTRIAKEEDLLVRFLASWFAGSAEPRTGASEADVREFEGRHALRLPAEFEAYIRRANGMQSGEMDSERLIRFYGIDEMAPLAGDEVGGDHYAGYFVFADFMIGSHEYAIALAGPHYGKVAIADDTGPPRIVAESFVDFMDKYLHAPAALWRAE